MRSKAQFNYSPPLLGSRASCAQVLPNGPFSKVAMSVNPVPAHPLMIMATIAAMNSRMSCLADDLAQCEVRNSLCTTSCPRNPLSQDEAWGQPCCGVPTAANSARKWRKPGRTFVRFCPQPDCQRPIAMSQKLPTSDLATSAARPHAWRSNNESDSS